MAGLPSVEGAVFALIGLLIAFTVSALFIDSTSAGNWSFKRRMPSAQPMIASICLKVKLRETFRKG